MSLELKFVADELAGLRKAIDRAIEASERREAQAFTAMQRLLDDRERVRSETIKVTATHPQEARERWDLHRIGADRVALRMDGRVAVRGMEVEEIHSTQRGLYRDPREMDLQIINAHDDLVLGVARKALDFEPELDATYLVRVRITSRDPDCWDWHDWWRL